MCEPVEISTHPIAIVEDRYTGTYSGDIWIAVAEADLIHHEKSRVDFIVSDQASGPHGDDLEAMRFWQDPPDWISVGDTPQQALDHLTQGVRVTPFRRKA